MKMFKDIAEKLNVPFFETEYKDRKVFIFNADCVDVLKELDKKPFLVDTVITDPPYGSTNLGFDKIGRKGADNDRSKHFDGLNDIQRMNDGYRLCTNLYYYPTTQDNAHPTSKPVKLLQRLVCEYSNKGDYVLDPFCGGGSTIVASILESRNAIGIEKDPIYFAESVKQVKKTIENLNNSFIGDL